MKLITLNAKKIKETTGIYKGLYRTEFFKPDGQLYATMPANSKQPNKNSKTITLNCFRWALKWNN